MAQYAEEINRLTDGISLISFLSILRPDDYQDIQDIPANLLEEELHQERAKTSKEQIESYIGEAEIYYDEEFLESISDTSLIALADIIDFNGYSIILTSADFNPEIKLQFFKDFDLINTYDSLGFTPIMQAAFFARADLIEELHKYGADLDLKSTADGCDGMTALALTMQPPMDYYEDMDEFFENSFEALLVLGANPNIKDYIEHTALTTALCENNVQAGRALLMYGADVAFLSSSYIQDFNEGVYSNEKIDEWGTIIGNSFFVD